MAAAGLAQGAGQGHDISAARYRRGGRASTVPNGVVSVPELASGARTPEEPVTSSSRRRTTASSDVFSDSLGICLACDPGCVFARNRNRTGRSGEPRSLVAPLSRPPSLPPPPNEMRPPDDSHRRRGPWVHAIGALSRRDHIPYRRACRHARLRRSAPGACRRATSRGTLCPRRSGYRTASPSLLSQTSTAGRRRLEADNPTSSLWGQGLVRCSARAVPESREEPGVQSCRQVPR